MFWGKPFDSAISNLKRQVSTPVRLVLWDGREFALSDDEAPRVTLRLRDSRAAAALAKPSLLTLAEAYIEGEAELEGDVLEAIRGAEAIARARTRGIFERGGTPGARHTREVDREAIRHHYDVSNEFYALWLDPRMVYSCGYFRDEGATLERSATPGARHTREADREAIRHHYDVSNEFYALWLDPRMVYSCGYFRDEGATLEQAQLAKLDHICTKLRLAPGERFLDIGCGWGALAIHAARAYGVDATGITLSENQHRLANERIRAAGLEGRCRVLLQDYRDHPGDGVYDKVASVGMFEHVGLKNLPVYFGTVARLLRERGLFLNHGITSSDTKNRAVGLGAGEFIGRYVFPKGELPHLHRVVHDMSVENLEVHDVECLRPHYAKTLALWSANFERRFAEAVAASSQRTARIWRLYLPGCAYAFEQRWISIHQILASKQTLPGRADLPLTRDWMYAK